MIGTLLLREPSEALAVAKLILDSYVQHRVFALHGDLGAGKTTLIKGFCAALGVVDQTSSPSFALVNEYRTADGDPVYHFDLYRLKHASELDAIGFTEYLDSGHYCFIEWPELANELLPPDTLIVRLQERSGGERVIALAAAGGL